MSGSTVANYVLLTSKPRFELMSYISHQLKVTR